MDVIWKNWYVSTVFEFQRNKGFYDTLQLKAPAYYTFLFDVGWNFVLIRKVKC